MALPLIPLAAGLGSLIASVFVSVVGFFAAIVGKKVAVSAALGVFLIAGWVAIQAALFLAWTALGWAVPDEMVVPLSFVRSILPTNTAPCLEVIVLAKIARWLWDAQREWAVATAGA